MIYKLWDISQNREIYLVIQPSELRFYDNRIISITTNKYYRIL